MLKAIARLVSPKDSDTTTILQKLHQASARLEAARILTEKENLLTQKATEAVYAKFPESLSSQTNSNCLNEYSNLSSDINYLLKIIIYSLVADSIQPIDDYVITDIRNNQKNTEVSVNWYKEALHYIKNSHGLLGEVAKEANCYIDYIISKLS